MSNGFGQHSPQGLTPDGMKMTAMRSRLRNREISERKQVGDAEGMVNEERAGRVASSEGLEQM